MGFWWPPLRIHFMLCITQTRVQFTFKALNNMGVWLVVTRPFVYSFIFCLFVCLFVSMVVVSLLFFSRLRGLCLALLCIALHRGNGIARLIRKSLKKLFIKWNYWIFWLCLSCGRPTTHIFILLSFIRSRMWLHLFPSLLFFVLYWITRKEGVIPSLHIFCV